MSTKSSFREALERRVETPAEHRSRSDTAARLRLEATGEIARPVALAKELVGCGLSLRAAHAALDRIAAGERVAVEIRADDLDAVVRALAALGVSASGIRRPDISARRVRERFGLSQAEFATRFGLETRTIQNWEQERYRLDPTTAILLAVIASRPDVVDDALTNGASLEGGSTRCREA